MSNELNHYGVKGMRWGVRRSQNRSGKSSGNRKTKSSDSELSAKSKGTSRKMTRSERKEARSAMKALCKKINRGDVVSEFDKRTGEIFGFYDSKSGESLPYYDVLNAMKYQQRKRAAQSFVATCAAVPVSMLIAKACT